MVQLADKYIKAVIVNMAHINKHNEGWTIKYIKKIGTFRDLKMQ